MAARKQFTNRKKPSFTEQSLAQGLGSKGHDQLQRALDYFSNVSARTGFNAPSLFSDADYDLVRFSYDYWSLITLFRNHWISRRIVETPAIDMVRAWPRLTGDIEPEDMGRLDRAVRKTGTRMQIRTAITWARLFGGAGALIVVEGQEKDLDQPLSLDDVPLGGYKGLCPFDRWAGITPQGEVCTDPSRPLDFNKPDYYRVTPGSGQSFDVHSSRILRFMGPEVPTPEREAQTWWGISVLEPVYEDIKKYDSMSWNILMLTYRANILGMKWDDLAQLLSGVGSNQKASAQFYRRMEAINHTMSNQSFVALPKDGGLESTQYSFAGLDTIYQLFQLAISGGSQIPVSRLWGRTYSGLGAPEDADERMYEEKVAADQSVGLVPQLEQLYPVICMSELGEVPKDLDLACPSIRVLDEKEKADLARAVTDTVTVALNSGGISKRTYAQELKQSSDKTGVFSNITDEFIQSLPDTVQDEGELGDPFGEEGGAPNLTPSSAPQKVLREEGKEKESQEQQKKQVDASRAIGAQLERLRHDTRQLAADAKETAYAEVLRDISALRDGASVRYQTADGCAVVVKFENGTWWTQEICENGVSGGTQFSRSAEQCARKTVALLNALRKAHASDADGVGPERAIHGLRVVVETPKGFPRHGKTPDGERWQTTMPADYGYIRGHAGADGDSLDCYVGPDPASRWVYVVDQSALGDRKRYDEAKCMIGFPSQDAALRAYDAGHHRAKDVMLDFTPMTIEDFKGWLAERDPKKPCSPTVTAR